MMKNKLVLLFFLLFPLLGFTQKFKVETGKVHFFSEATLENIEAVNERPNGLIDLESGEFAFLVNIQDFEFDKALMKEHFNEKYMDSEKYPRGIFTGTLKGMDADLSGRQTVTAEGKMTLHGETKPVSVKGTVSKKGNQLEVEATFIVRLEDYDIDRPQILWQNIAEEIEVTVNFIMTKQ